MPRNFSKYQYETSPRKIQPKETPAKNTPKPKKKSTAKKTIIKKMESKNIKEQKKKKAKIVSYILIGFAIVFVISYRNAQIDERFSNIQNLKQELAETEKQNAQLEIAIESGLNLNNLAKQAKELLGMQKLTRKQAVYVDSPQTDYIQAATEEIRIEDEESFITKILNNITNIFE